MSIHPNELGTTLVGPCDDFSRWTAIQRLVRPSEVVDLRERILSNPIFHDGLIGDEVGIYLDLMFRQALYRYTPDPDWSDRWQSAGTTAARGRGDCEDWAIVAYAVMLGLPVDACIVTGTLHGRGHAWVEFEDRGGWGLLEATTGEVDRHIRPARYRAELVLTIDNYTRIKPPLRTPWAA